MAIDKRKIKKTGDSIHQQPQSLLRLTLIITLLWHYKIRTMVKLKQPMLYITVALIYVAATLITITPLVDILWLPAGIAVVAMLQLGYRVWPLIFTASLLYFIIDPYISQWPLAALIAYPIANVLTALCITFFSRQWAPRPAKIFDSPGGIIKFSLLTGVIGVLSSGLSHSAFFIAEKTIEQKPIDASLFTEITHNAIFLQSWLSQSLGHFAAILFVTPLFFAVRQTTNNGTAPNQTSPLSTFMQPRLMMFTFTTISLLLLASHQTLLPALVTPLIFLPIICWALVQFGQIAGLSVIGVFTLTMMVVITSGFGAFAQLAPTTAIITAQLYLIVYTLFCLLFGVVVKKNQQVQQQLLQLTSEHQQLTNEHQQLTNEHQQAKRFTDQTIQSLNDDKAAAIHTITQLLDVSTLPGGKSFFDQTTKALSQIYQTQYAFLGIFADDSKTSIATLSVWAGHEHLDNFNYQLLHTPCQDVLNLSVELIPKNATTCYPHDQMLVDMEIESYAGAPIVSIKNEIIGIVVVMNTAPTKTEDWSCSALKLIANRIGFEIEQRKVEQKLKLAASVFDDIIEGVVICNSQRQIIEINAAFKQLSGFASSQIIGQTLEYLSADVNASQYFEPIWQTVVKDGYWQGEVNNKRNNSDPYPCSQTITAVKDQQGNIDHYIAVFNDISVRQKAEASIKNLAHYDQLTALPNRNLLIEYISSSLIHAKRHQHMVGLLFVNLDHFKLINNSSNHSTGDMLLVQVAQRLQRFAGKNIFVARLGGDEFALVVLNNKDRDALADLANDILVELSSPFSFDGGEIILSASIGYSCYPNDANTSLELLKNADLAMYKAKELGRGKYCQFTFEMHQLAQQRVEIEHELRTAIDARQFVVHYQPQQRLSDGMIIGCEALVRWAHPTKGMLPPGIFIPIAELSGLIVPIGNWVLEEACRQFVSWHEQGIMLQQVAINLSARQFMNHDLDVVVERILNNTGMKACHLELELTESMLMENVKETIATLEKLSNIGVLLSIDDFGTGYSSLAYLKHFPIDKLKIDRSFINDLLVSRKDEAIVNSTISLAHGLGLKVIAEGVENAEQSAYLKEHQCEEIQGYYLSMPAAPNNPNLHQLLTGKTPSKSAFLPHKKRRVLFSQ